MFVSAVTQAAEAWRPGWNAGTIAAPVGTLGHVHLVLAAGLTLAIALVAQRVRSRGKRRELTWDCGYAEPTPRMQYTSGAFGSTVAGWFSPVLRPERSLRRPRGLFPGRAAFLVRVPEAVLERMIEPVAGIVLRVSTLVRRLQHGRVQFYVVYVAVGLAAVGTLVVLEGRP
jgi:hydrogenase-4 component B